MFLKSTVFLFLIGVAGLVHAQGQDSETYERDLLVISTMLPGGFDNSNQSYFDFRGKRDARHRRLHVDIEKLNAPGLGKHAFLAAGYWDNDRSKSSQNQIWVLSPDDESGSVRMRSWTLDDATAPESINSEDDLQGLTSCDLYWRREAAQFRARAGEDCADAEEEVVLSETQLWIAYAGKETADYQLHRVRDFQCHADIPGVGGGRAIPFERYDGLAAHDQGGSASFTTSDGREITVNLLVVDWPINNYDGEFARDSLVMYLSEVVDEKPVQHGYTFTVPDADRIGLNLKWILVQCYMTSNKVDTPYM